MKFHNTLIASTASNVDIREVLEKLVLVGILLGGLVFLWNFGRGVPRSVKMARGLAYFSPLFWCGLGTLAINTMAEVDETWLWVGFLATGLVSSAGIAVGYKAMDDELEAEKAGYSRPSPLKTLVEFLCAAGGTLLIFYGFFPFLGFLLNLFGYR